MTATTVKRRRRYGSQFIYKLSFTVTRSRWSVTQIASKVEYVLLHVLINIKANCVQIITKRNKNEPLNSNIFASLKSQ